MILYPLEHKLGPQAIMETEPETPLLGDTLSEDHLKQARCLTEALPRTFTAMLGETTQVCHTICTNPREVIHGTTQPLLRD